MAEPVEKWTNLNNHNLLDLMYKHPTQWLFPFQSYALLSSLQNHIQPVQNKIKLMERSIFSSFYCFTEASSKTKTIHPAQYSILQEWFKYIQQNHPSEVDQIIYLRSSPEIVADRIKKRGRPEEANINLDYLKLLHQLHEDWLIQKSKPLPAPVHIIDADLNETEIISQYKQISKKFFRI